MAKINQILDTEELLKKNFEVTFSSYWQRIEPLIKRAHITLAIILIVILGRIIVRNFSYLSINTDEVSTEVPSIKLTDDKVKPTVIIEN